MSDDDALAKELAELIPQMQRAAEVALADAKGRERKQRSRVIDALMSEVGAYVRGRRNDPCFGIGEQVSDLTSTGRALSSAQVAAFSALAAYAYALEAAWDHGAGRATAEKVTEQLEAARKHAREVDAPRAPAPNPADVRARVLRLVPGDDRELAALTAVIVEHRLV
ncbi:MAG: hypothetical protein IT379_19895, partial [Deltaproteobacteria bacterium]|nr:hypothetical protein [Deltaproteobacteria bacterium]